ncbi:MAG: glycosyltransferase family 2 protein [Planctomycetota bacterium]|nr:glycosyltransferase family 2 protein [Planctomycetota bacterium]
MKTSFVIPCYQEEAALAAFADVLPDIPAEEVVFVDDGSTDGTAAALAALAERDDRVRVETHEANRGVGAAMRTGIAATAGDVVVVYDVDRTYPLADARKLIDRLGGDADVVTATPYGVDGAWQDVPWFRRLLSGGAAWAYRVVLGRRAKGISCMTCAFRAYQGELVRGLRFQSDGFPAAAEMLGRLLLAGARVVEVPSALSARTEGQSKMRVVRATLGHVGNLWRLFWARLFGRRAAA